MKKLLLVAISTMFMTSSIYAQVQSELPKTIVTNLKGQKVPFNETVEKGKVTIISFWATWCVPCKKEIKSVRENLAKWQAETPELNYMTVSLDESKATAQVRSYAKAQGWEFPTYLDPNSDLKRSLNFQNVPFVIIVDKEGKIQFMHAGYEEGGEHVLYEKAKELAAKK